MPSPYMRRDSKTLPANCRALQQNAHTATNSDAEAALFKQIVDDIATACHQANARFNRGRFERASGLVEIEHASVNRREDIVCAL